MDTSETYIKMRLAAIPDLGMGIPPEEYYSQTDNGWYSWQSTTVFIDGRGNWYYSTIDETTQLERQDQLQGMVEPNPFNLLTGLADWYHRLSYSESMKYQSMEQLWLAFVMFKRLGKVWNGENWIKE